MLIRMHDLDQVAEKLEMSVSKLLPMLDYYGIPIITEDWVAGIDEDHYINLICYLSSAGKHEAKILSLLKQIPEVEHELLGKQIASDLSKMTKVVPLRTKLLYRVSDWHG